MAADVGPVVVATDFSETAGIALVEARRLAALLRTRLVVVHVVDGAASGWCADGEAGEWLRGAGVAVEDLVVRFGRPWVELARYAADVLPTLVVVGSHGVSGYQPLTLGSTAARVSMHAGCPVVLVSPRVRPLQDEGVEVYAGRGGAAAGARTKPGGQ
jgi:nucleotide-binding universal stress UspA family protein